MFESIGRNTDNFFADILAFNRKLFWYKIYCYYFLKRNLKLKTIESAYNCKYLYKYQYNRLLNILKKYNKLNKEHEK